MRSVMDGDKERLEQAVGLIDEMDCRGHANQEIALMLLRRVLANMALLDQPATHSQARIVPLTPADERLCYPERFKA